MRFIDRINLHYKVGAFAQVPFHNDIEETFIQRAFMTETFQDVYDLAKEIYEYEKSQPIPKDEGIESSVSKKKKTTSYLIKTLKLCLILIIQKMMKKKTKIMKTVDRW